MNLISLGINHNSAHIDVRERVAFAPEQVGDAMHEACRHTGLDEVVVLSTCNRTEIYAVGSCSGLKGASSPQAERTGEQADAQATNDASVDRDSTAQSLLNWLASYHRLAVNDLSKASYLYQGEEAFRHLIQVAAGLDSMVLGEPQIFGQLKSAFAVANEVGTVGSELGRLFPRAFSIAKRVRTDTAIGENPVSVAFAAVDIARRIFTDLNDCKALLVGAGETIELVTRHLVEAGVNEIVIANRTLARARGLAEQFSADAVMLADIPHHLASADIVISSTASQLPIIGKGTVEEALKKRRHRPILMVDIAVPRDIEPQVADLRDIYLYSVDDLTQIVDTNIRARQDEVRKADQIIAEGLAALGQDERALEAVDLVKQYRLSAENIRRHELDRALAAVSRGEDPQRVMVQLTRSITNKLIHAPTAGLKRASAEGRNDILGHATRLLGLQVTDASSSPISNKSAGQPSESSDSDALVTKSSVAASQSQSDSGDGSGSTSQSTSTSTAQETRPTLQ
ncbi:MAG: glutamyl-tRNA reductase [Pseudomonadota bacterium]